MTARPLATWPAYRTYPSPLPTRERPAFPGATWAQTRKGASIRQCRADAPFGYALGEGPMNEGFPVFSAAGLASLRSVW